MSLKLITSFIAFLVCFGELVFGVAVCKEPIVIASLETDGWRNVPVSSSTPRLSQASPFSVVLKLPSSYKSTLAMIDAEGAVTWFGQRSGTVHLSEFDLQRQLLTQQSGQFHEGLCYLIVLPTAPGDIAEITEALAVQVAKNQQRCFGSAGPMNETDYLRLCDQSVEYLRPIVESLLSQQNDVVAQPIVFHHLLRTPPEAYQEAVKAAGQLSRIVSELDTVDVDDELVTRSLHLREKVVAFFSPPRYPLGDERAVRADSDAAAILSGIGETGERQSVVHHAIVVGTKLLETHKSQSLSFEVGKALVSRAQDNLRRNAYAESLLDLNRAAKLFEDASEPSLISDKVAAARFINGCEIDFVTQMIGGVISAGELSQHYQARVDAFLQGRARNARALTAVAYVSGRCACLFVELGAYDSAASWARERLRVVQELLQVARTPRTTGMLCTAYCDIGNVSLLTGDLATARRSLELCAAMIEAGTYVDCAVRMNCYLALAHVHRDLLDPESATEWCNRVTEELSEISASSKEFVDAMGVAARLLAFDDRREAKSKLILELHRQAAKYRSYVDEDGIDAALSYCGMWFCMCGEAHVDVGDVRLGELRAREGLSTMRRVSNETSDQRTVRLRLALLLARCQLLSDRGLAAIATLQQVEDECRQDDWRVPDELWGMLLTHRVLSYATLGWKDRWRHAIVEDHLMQIALAYRQSAGFGFGIKDQILESVTLRESHLLRLATESSLRSDTVLELLWAKDRRMFRGYGEHVSAGNVRGRLRGAATAFWGRRADLVTTTSEIDFLDEGPSAFASSLRERSQISPISPDLSSVLSPGICVVEFVRAERPGGEPPRYAAFVVQHEKEIEFVDLGPVTEIDEAIIKWRQAIEQGQPADSARQLLRLRLWIPIEKQFDPRVQRVSIAPDGPLCQIPWCALPSRQPGQVLLEDYTLGILPYGAYLADRRLPDEAQQGTTQANESWLLVGNVDYDQRAGTNLQNTPPSENGPFQWAPLPYTKVELEQVASLLPTNTPTVRLEGADATSDRVLDQLAKCRKAHLATHAFYANPRLQSELGIDTDQARRTLARRHPLILNGLAFAGANLGPRRDELGLPTDDGGLVTGNIIANLPLSHLELIVLSGCETGAGTTAGDGTVGLQRAFHLAGARNVVATLWKVDDQGTAALMKLFYHYQLVDGLSPIEALRQAQLALLHHPQQVEQLAQLRGPNFHQAAKKLVANQRSSTPQLAERHWAAFTLSGLGQ